MCVLKFKKGVKVAGIQPEMVIFLNVALGVAFEMGLKELWVTSVVEGKHRRGSLHFLGQGIDLRNRKSTGNLKRWPSEFKEKFARKLRTRLTSEYDVVISTVNIHGEFQPKTQV